MSDKNQQDFLGKKILQNCRNELYLDFPYLDGAFASLEYEADNNISTMPQTERNTILIRNFL